MYYIQGKKIHVIDLSKFSKTMRHYLFFFFKYALSDSSFQEAGEGGYGSGQVTSQESCGLMVQNQLQPHDRNVCVQ